MATKTRCFATVKALKRLNPELLCATLRMFPEYMRDCHIRLPKKPDADRMPFAAIQQACMSGNIPPELDDVLFFVCTLGTSEGWTRIQEEARFQGCALDFLPNNLTTADLAMKAWLHDWPNNRRLLEQSFARAKIYDRSSYVYYAPSRDVRSQYRRPTEAALTTLREDLSEYFVRQGLGRGTSVVSYNFEKEIWFLIRYPGHPRRYAAISDDGEPTSYMFKPEEYDAVVYHKEYGDLRMNTNRPTDHIHYRIAFAAMLLDEHMVFDRARQIVSLDPLKLDCERLFRCDDVPGLSEIALVELRYASLFYPGAKITIKADKDCDLLSYHPQRDHTAELSCEQPVPPPLSATDTIHFAKFRYRRRDTVRNGLLTVHAGNTLTYERDGDSSVLEDWLRRRKFITYSLPPLDDAARTAQTA